MTAVEAAAPAERWWGDPVAELRWYGESLRLVRDPVFRGKGVAPGDGRPVVLVPGFMCGDPSMALLHDWLRRVGYRAYRAGIALNADCSDRALDRLEHRAASIAEARGARLTLIGHSRGGIFSRALAARRPDLVERVVTLGSGLSEAFGISVGTHAMVGAVSRLHRLTTDRRTRNGCLTASCRCRFTQDYARPFPDDVDLVSIYSRSDGILAWRTCLVPYAETIEVRGSHVGLPVNAEVFRAVGRVLAGAAGA